VLVSYRNPKTGRWDKPPVTIPLPGEHDTDTKMREEIEQWLRHHTISKVSYGGADLWCEVPTQQPTQWRTVLFVAGALACLLAFIAVRYWRG
jgi:hypothetical protein